LKAGETTLNASAAENAWKAGVESKSLEVAHVASTGHCHALAAHDGVLYAYVLMTDPFHLPITLALLRMLDCINRQRVRLLSAR
jgi:hypothetical protein